MPNASTTQGSSASQTTGQPVPLDYGYVLVTGKREDYYVLQETGLDGLNYTRAGFWKLGEGEWDGLQQVWINDKLAWVGNTVNNDSNANWLGWNWYKTLDYPKQDIVLHWHSGCDSTIGSGLTPQSVGPDNNCDLLWKVFPPSIQPQCWSRIVYVGLMRKQPILWQQSDSQSDPSQWTDINPIFLCRALRCRLFDAEGNVTGYAFTRNPVWHWVDVKLRRELFPDYNLTLNVGPDPLPEAVADRFDWPTIYASAMYCNELLPSGYPRFSGDYAFAQTTSLQAIVSQMLQVCRGFERETFSRIGVVVDQPRPSVFTFSRQHMLPGTWSADDRTLNTAGNRVVAQFRDLLVPACCSILSITNSANGNPVVTTDSIPRTGEPQPHPFMQGDTIWMGGTDTVYDGQWTVYSVPAIVNPGYADAVYPTTFELTKKGANYPASVGAVGLIGLEYSRFKERSPIFDHKQNQLARGIRGLNIARQREHVLHKLDMATSTYDQASRIARYERDRNLGLDQSPYVAPAAGRCRISMFAKDVNGNLACAVQPGDRVSLDDTARYPYAGDYEVVDGHEITPLKCEVTGSGGSIRRTPDPNSGEIEFPLRSYDEAYFYDTSDPLQAGWPSVPGSFPGNDQSFTSIPLANGGNFVFFTGQLPTGSAFQLPSTGYPAANVMAWASPAGANAGSNSAHVVQLCNVDGSLLLTLVYADEEGHAWGGDVNYAALTWLSPDVTNTDSNGMTWLPLTLLGGEEILFGTGIVPDGGTIELPAGWESSQCWVSPFIHDMGPTGHIMYLVGAWADGLTVHCQAQDHSGNTWAGNASVMVFAWKNNMGTVTNTAGDGFTGGWLEFPLSDGSKFGVLFAQDVANGFTLTLAADAGDGSTLAPMVGPSDLFYTASGGHAQGVGSCYLDGNFELHCTFNDGGGDTWNGTANVFATYTKSATAPAVVVTVSPASVTIPQGAATAFAATVLGNSNQAVTWSVDGVTGGNSAVGKIDSSGNYVAPPGSGQHTITATSALTGSPAGSAVVNVTGAANLRASVSGGNLVVDIGGTGQHLVNEPLSE
jgi:hypothetical protein